MKRHPAGESHGTRRALTERGIVPARGMGQNFLTDAGTAQWIADQLEIDANDTVIEIGPGMGALTAHLTGRAARVVLLEKDDQLVDEVRRRFGAVPGVTVVHGDALTFDLRPWFKTQPLKVIGNLPYSVGTEIVRRWLRNPSPVQRAVFTLQREVGDRLSASPGSPDYGLLSLRTQVRWNAKTVRRLPPELFVPRPRVESSVVVLTPRDRHTLPVFDANLFDRLLTAGFSQRRKMLTNLLPTNKKSWEALAASAGIPVTARGQELSLEAWIALTNAFDPAPSPQSGQSGDEWFDVVDENNCVERTARRREVHACGWRHRAVHVFVLNSRQEVFLQKRSHLKDMDPGRWDSSAAGHLDAGEAYVPCAVRELKEELGIECGPDELTLAAEVPAGAATGWEFVQLFTIRRDGPFTWPPAEIEAGEWLSPCEIDAWVAARPADFAGGFVECWKRYQAAPFP